MTGGATAPSQADTRNGRGVPGSTERTSAAPGSLNFFRLRVERRAGILYNET